MPFNELIARLETASEGSRELDVAIADGVRNWAIAEDPAWRRYPHGVEVHAETVAPAYTTIIDIALTLVGSGSWGCGYDDSTSSHFAWVACDEAITAATEPLALCIAALKARQATGGGDAV
jgi:hypothetical protein